MNGLTAAKKDMPNLGDLAYLYYIRVRFEFFHWELL